MKTLKAMNYEPEGQRSYKTFPRRIVQASGVGQRWPLLKWCCPFCFDKPPISRRGSRVPVIKVTRARTPDSDSDEQINEPGKTSSRENEPATRGKIVYRRGYGKGLSSHRQIDPSSDDEKDDVLSDDSDLKRSSADSNSEIDSHVTTPEGSMSDVRRNSETENDKKRSSLTGFKNFFRKSKTSKTYKKTSDKPCSEKVATKLDVDSEEKRKLKFFNKEKNDNVLESKNRDKKSSSISKYNFSGRSKNIGFNSKSRPSDGVSAVDELSKKSHKLEDQGSTDSEPLILSDDPVSCDDTLEFENLPMKNSRSMTSDPFDGQSTTGLFDITHETATENAFINHSDNEETSSNSFSKIQRRTNVSRVHHRKLSNADPIIKSTTQSFGHINSCEDTCVAESNANSVVMLAKPPRTFETDVYRTDCDSVVSDVDGNNSTETECITTSVDTSPTNCPVIARSDAVNHPNTAKCTADESSTGNKTEIPSVRRKCSTTLQSSPERRHTSTAQNERSGMHSRTSKMTDWHSGENSLICDDFKLTITVCIKLRNPPALG